MASHASKGVGSNRHGNALRKTHEARVYDRSGAPVKIGDVILDQLLFPWIFAGVARLPSFEQPGQIYVRDVRTHAYERDYFSQGAFNLTILL